MFKFLSTIFVSFSLMLSPINAVAVEVFEGGWQDGVKIEWACPSNTKGAIPFQITMTDGQIYRGVVSCGHPV